MLRVFLAAVAAGLIMVATAMAEPTASCAILEMP